MQIQEATTLLTTLSSPAEIRLLLHQSCKGTQFNSVKKIDLAATGKRLAALPTSKQSIARITSNRQDMWDQLVSSCELYTILWHQCSEDNSVTWQPCI